MPMEAQTRLLRVLQQGEYTTVGWRTPIKAELRIIAGHLQGFAHPDPARAVPEDLYFR
jgi:two-component system nitrogen regulation response regulator GlnG